MQTRTGAGRRLDVVIVVVIVVSSVGAAWALISRLMPDTSRAGTSDALEIAERLDELAISSLHLVPELRDPGDSFDEIVEDIEAAASLVSETLVERSPDGIDPARTAALVDEARLLSQLETAAYSDVRALARQLQDEASQALLAIDGGVAAQIRSARAAALSAQWLVAEGLATGVDIDLVAYADVIEVVEERLDALDALDAGSIELDDTSSPTIASFDELHELVTALESVRVFSLSTSGPPRIVGPAAFVVLLVSSAMLLSRRRRVVARDRRDQDQRVRFLAAHDELTGLLNRGAVIDAYEMLKSPAGSAVLVIDLDGFKEINDRFGHHAGNFVLQVVAGRLRSAVREIDVAGRFGGDEFVVLLPQANDPAVVESVAMRIIASIIEPMLFEGASLSVGSSAGAAFIGSGGVASAVRDADAALYRAKRSGKGRLVMHPAMDRVPVNARV